METTVITTTCGIIYSRQVEWLMWKSGWAANKTEGHIGQFLCDFKQCPHCPWQVSEIWIVGTAASSLCWLSQLGPPPTLPTPRDATFSICSQRRESRDPFNFSSLGVVSGGSHLADVTGNSADSQRTDETHGALRESLGLLASLCAFWWVAM